MFLCYNDRQICLKNCKFVQKVGMFFMDIKINTEKLNDIMKAFYAITGIRPVIFDSEYKRIYAYPADDCAFCKKMRGYPHTAQRCVASDGGIFAECKKSGKLMIYTCHAGLVEGCAPLRQNGKVFGYIMFGQISDLPDRRALLQNISDVCREYCLDEREFLDVAESIKLKSYDDIISAAKIFEACASYILLNEMLMPEHDKTMIEGERYIDANLGDVSVENLCKHLNMSRTALYDVFRRKTGQGVAAFIRTKRLEEARRLLTQTDLSISEISERCGFADYNYFSRVFKKRFGCTAKSMKNK